NAVENFRRCGDPASRLLDESIDHVNRILEFDGVDRAILDALLADIDLVDLRSPELRIAGARAGVIRLPPKLSESKGNADTALGRPREGSDGGLTVVEKPSPWDASARKTARTGRITWNLYSAGRA